MTKMKSYRLQAYTLQMIEEIQKDTQTKCPGAHIIRHAIWDYYEKYFGKTVNGEMVLELERKWLSTHESSKSDQGAS